MTEQPSSDPRTSGAESIFREFLRRRDAGEDLDFETLCREHAEITGALRLLHSIHGGETEAALATAGIDDGELDTLRPLEPGRTADYDRIGPYLILEVIGEGGMGVVHRAEQSEPLRRAVALKLIKPGMDTREVIARFEAERQALAMMDHPNIAKVYDAGRTPDGRPFFAMEYVPGIPITDHCDHLRLSTRERLELFSQVCDAVQHAHQKAVIHRDLKPSNVLVLSREDGGLVKVIDFGVAKALGQRLTERTLFTEQGQIIGTPEYMSPEQAAPTPQGVDTRTDVYSLGVLLYQLLSGSLPFDSTQLRRAGFAEIQRIICEEEPPKPSTRVSRLDPESSGTAEKRRTQRQSLLRELRGDLDWITMKALEKDRSRRYATPSELAADIARHLDHQPVLASPPSRSYVAKKFLWRHRYAVSAIAAIAASLAIGLVASEVLYLRAEDNARRAQRNFQAARSAVDDYFTKVSETTLLQVPGMQPLRKELLESALDYYRKFVKEHQGDATVEAELVAAYERVGHLEREIGSSDEARKAYEEALDLLERLMHDAPRSKDYRARRVEILTSLGRVQTDAGLLDEGRGSFHSAIELGKAIVEEADDDLEREHTLARSYLYLGHLERGEPGRTEVAGAAFLESVSIARRVAAADPESEDFEETLGSALHALSLYQSRKGNLDEAIDTIKSVIHLRELRLERDLTPHQLELTLHFVCGNYNNLGALQREKAHTEQDGEVRERLLNEALESFETSVNRGRVVHERNPAVAEYANDLAFGHMNVMSMKWEMGHREEALEHVESAIGIVRPLVARDPATIQYSQLLGDAYRKRSMFQEQAGKTADAGSSLDRLIELYEDVQSKVQGPENEYGARRGLASAYRERAMFQQRTGKLAEACESLGRAIKINESLRAEAEGPSERNLHRELARDYSDLGLFWIHQGNDERAIASLRQAVSLGVQLVEEDVQDIAAATTLGGSYCNLGIVVERRKPEDAIPEYDRAVNLLRETLEKEGGSRSQAENFFRVTLRCRARALASLGRHENAIADWNELMSLDSSRVTADMVMSRAWSLAATGDHARASREVEGVVSQRAARPTMLYDGARVLSRSAEAARRDQKLGKAERDRLSEEYALRAVEMLTAARRASFFDEPGKVDFMESDADLDALRSREDFEKLLGELAGGDKTVEEDAPKRDPEK